MEIRAEQARLMVTVTYGEIGECGSAMRYTVGIVRTRCHLGGLRAWFICPTPVCGRRVAVLYVGGTLACRHCLRLAYASTREDIGDRAMRCAEKVRARLQWRPGIANATGSKPKWMHRNTYHRLWWNHEALVRQSLQAIAQKLACPV
jgi:hypothetical protein